MKIDVSGEIVFSTARSGGKGGQNVNKVETMVEGRWQVASSAFFSVEDKRLIAERLANKITEAGDLLVKSQIARTQLGNKTEVVKKINALIALALEKKKARIATRPGKAMIEKRIEHKKTISQKKQNRRKVRPGDLF